MSKILEVLFKIVSSAGTPRVPIRQFMKVNQKFLGFLMTLNLAIILLSFSYQSQEFCCFNQSTDFLLKAISGAIGGWGSYLLFPSVETIFPLACQSNLAGQLPVF